MSTEPEPTVHAPADPPATPTVRAPAWRPVVLVAAALAALAALGWAAWVTFNPPPTFDARRLSKLAEARRFDEAEALLEDHLRLAPRDPEAHLTLGQLLLDRNARDEPDATARDRAGRALEHLRLARLDDPRRAAVARMLEGKALYVLRRWDDAEAAFLDALRIDPRVPEAGWGLLDLYYLQGRAEDARRLALKLYDVEPDAHDRAQLLLELVRQDAQPPAPASLVTQFEPVARAQPGGVRSAVALGLALVHDSRADRGVEVLRRVVAEHGDDSVAWDGLLSGLDDAGQADGLTRALKQLPAGMADDPRFARYRGRAAQERNDWPAAVREYRRALAFDPHDPKVVYRLARALRFAGETAEAERIEALDAGYKSATREVRALFQEANAESATLGLRPHPDLYRRLGDLRERMLRPEEARAWYRLALKDRPDDAEVRAALNRLEARRAGP